MKTQGSLNMNLSLNLVTAALAVFLTPLQTHAGNVFFGGGVKSDGVFTVEEEDDRLLISLHDGAIAQFVFRDEKILRPYFANLHTPNGLQVTRNHPPIDGTDAIDHDTMHPGVWLGFGDISGNDYWRNKSRIAHLRFTEPPSAEDDKLSFATESQLLTSDGQPLCRMICRFTLVSRASGWLLIWDATFHPDKRDLMFGDQEEMGFGARVATPMTEKNGGRIVNSDGLQTAAKTWGQPAKWCDYAGTVGDLQGGITLMAAPSNFRESWWHNRDYGVFVANPFGRAAMQQGERSVVTVKRGESLRITFGALMHDGNTIDADAEYSEFEKLARIAR